MKKILCALLLSCIFLFTACIETTSETSIDAKGGGKLSVVMDMGKLFDLMKMVGKDPAETMKGETSKDSVFNFKDKIAEIEKDQGRPLTADEKALIDKTTGRVEMNLEKKMMRITINSEFTKLSQLSMFQEIQKMAMNKPPMDDEKAEGEQAEKAMEFAEKPSKAMSFNAKDGLIENVYDKTKYEMSPEDEAALGQIDQVKPMLGDMPMTLVYKLPRPVKNVTAGAKYELSEDKKTVTIKYDLLDTFKDPSVQAYKIEY
jgi:hypothetical protein